MRVLFITVNRSDYGIWRPILRLINSNSPNLEVGIYATGGHLSVRHGQTISEVKQDGFYKNLFAFPCTSEDDSALGAAASMSAISKSLGRTLHEYNPEMIFVLGDRFEVLTAALTASLYRVPIVHFHGGSITEGAIDDNFRHAITKLSHYHFVECEEFKQRLIQLGEDSSKIYISGAPSLNALKYFKPMGRDRFQKMFLNSSSEPFVLATLHSETTKSLSYNEQLAKNFFSSFDDFPATILITAPNPDPNSVPIFKHIASCSEQKPDKYIFIPHLGHENYFNALFHCQYVAGNSSSGIIEASAFKKIALNIGERQKNRAHDPSVIHCGISKTAILGGLHKIREKLVCPNTFRNWEPIYLNLNSENTILDFFKSKKSYYQKSFVDFKKEILH